MTFANAERAVKSVLLVAAAFTLCACGMGQAAYGRVTSAAAAIAAAQALTDLDAPVVVIGQPRRGRASDLYTGIRSSCPAGSSMCDEAAARRERTAWRVDLAGLSPSNCPMDPCPGSLNEELVIDEATGALLYSYYSADTLPPGSG